MYLRKDVITILLDFLKKLELDSSGHWSNGNYVIEPQDSDGFVRLYNKINKYIPIQNSDDDFDVNHMHIKVEDETFIIDFEANFVKDSYTITFKEK